MTRDEAAAALDGKEYRNEGSNELFDAMKAAGLVAVFGASDDLAELRGAIDDEVGCFDGGTISLTADGLLLNECSNDDCPHFKRLQESAPTIEAMWDEGGIAWSYRTNIPHSTFTIMEDGEPYCKGIVFALADAA